MSSGYSTTPLAKKLGLKAGFNALFINKPSHYFELFEGFPEDVEILKGGKVDDVDFIHLFVKSKIEFEDRYQYVRPLLKKNGTLWVSWPKRNSRIDSDLNRDDIRAYGLANGLVDVKVCSIDEDWSALKFVYSVEDR